MHHRSSLYCLAALAGAAFFSAATAQDTCLEEVTTAFDNANIPANASLNFNPDMLLEVVYPQTSGPSIQVKAGDRLTINHCYTAPIRNKIHSPFCRTLGTFVLAMVDLDAPTPQNTSFSQVRHILAGNLKPEAPDAFGFSLLSNFTPAVTPYIQPGPTAPSDPHRYVWLLYDQSPDFNNQTLVPMSADPPLISRISFNISQFALEVGLGNPVAGSFMLVGPDSD